MYIFLLVITHVIFACVIITNNKCLSATIRYPVGRNVPFCNVKWQERETGILRWWRRLFLVG